MEKKWIREQALKLGADAAGFASAEDYRSPRSPDLKSLMPRVRSLIVLGYRELDGALESENDRVAMGGRMAVMNLGNTNSYRLARMIENKFGVRAAPVAMSYPLDMSPPVLGLIGDVSLRHAAVAAGLGVFGRHNLVIHPEFGSRIVFSALLTELPLETDPPVTEELCTDCDLCVKKCPAGALDVEGRTDNLKCLRVSQPSGIGGLIGYLRKFAGASPDEWKKLVMDPKLLNLYQASLVGFQYQCFRCITVCPVGRKKKISEKRKD